MKRALLVCAALIVSFLSALPAEATTPCAFHGANAPAVDYIANGQAVLVASGGIGGCPKPSHAAVTVEVQHLESGAWVTEVSGSDSRNWTVSWRYARQIYVTLRTTCIPGDWRTRVTGGDGNPPFEWISPVATFKPGDSGVCGSYGGGD